jgi:hypothetical protein
LGRSFAASARIPSDALRLRVSSLTCLVRRGRPRNKRQSQLVTTKNTGVEEVVSISPVQRRARTHEHETRQYTGRSMEHDRRLRSSGHKPLYEPGADGICSPVVHATRNTAEAPGNWKSPWRATRLEVPGYRFSIGFPHGLASYHLPGAVIQANHFFASQPPATVLISSPVVLSTISGT